MAGNVLFNIDSGIKSVRRASKGLLAADLPNIKGGAAAPILLGEFVQDGAGGKVGRGTTGVGATKEANKMQYAVLDDFGRTDVQSAQKLTIARVHEYEATTKVYDAVTNAIAVGDFVSVQTLAAGTYAGKRGLAKVVAAHGIWIQGIVTAVDSTAGTITFINKPFWLV